MSSCVAMQRVPLNDTQLPPQGRYRGLTYLLPILVIRFLAERPPVFPQAASLPHRAQALYQPEMYLAPVDLECIKSSNNMQLKDIKRELGSGVVCHLRHTGIQSNGLCAGGADLGICCDGWL